MVRLKHTSNTFELPIDNEILPAEPGHPFGPELNFWAEQSDQIIIGTDEAGRGPLAGPVVAAAAAFAPSAMIEGIGDSKALTEAKRNKLFLEVQKKSLAWAIVEKSPQRIDEINILEATREAMREAVNTVADQLECANPIVLVDGRIPPLNRGKHINVIKGDARSFTIGAASILAKVYRDRLMLTLDKQYPHYGFADHKGYPTPKHQQLIREYGASPCHRQTFTMKNADGIRVPVGTITGAKRS